MRRAARSACPRANGYLRLRWRRNGRASDAGRVRHRRNSDDGGCCNGDRADDSKNLPPTFDRHADPGDRERGVVAGGKRGRRENESDKSARQRRSGGREDRLPDDERESAGRAPDEQSSSDTRFRSNSLPITASES